MLSPRNKGAGKRFREPFGKAGLTVAILALVFAMVGGAWAAAGLNSKQKKEVKSIAKSFQGTGAAGAAGAAGPAGPKGDTGPKGDKGDKGDTGATGKQGIQGKEGKEGSPWTAGGTLPPGQTETGTWSVSLPPSEAFFEIKVPISFPIPLAEAGPFHYAEGEATGFYFTKSQVENEEFEVENEVTHTMYDSGCRWALEGVEVGDLEGKPEATVPGTLCVFSERDPSNTTEGFFRIPGNEFESGYGTTGSQLLLFHGSGGSGPIVGGGVWAVRAPEA